MVSLARRVRRTGTALIIALSLMVLLAMATPLLSGRLANLLPGPDVVLADDVQDGN